MTMMACFCERVYELMTQVLSHDTLYRLTCFCEQVYELMAQGLSHNTLLSTRKQFPTFRKTAVFILRVTQ